MAGKGVIQNRLSQPLGSKYLSATDHTEVNCTEFVTQEDTIITLLEGGDASVAATDVDYKSSMNLDGVTLKKGALIVSPAGEAFQNINISQGSVLAYNSVFKGEKPGSFVGLLDDYPDAAAAYSLRKLRADYAGPAIEVRKTVANTTFVQDIGFVGNELDTASLLSFAEGGDVFVAKWYDQSGEGNDATNTSESSQPRIVLNGSLVTESGMPCIELSANPDYFLRSDFGSSSNLDKTLLIVGKESTGSDTFGPLVSSFDISPGELIFTGRNGDDFSSFASGVELTNAWTTYENQYLLHFSYSDSLGAGEWFLNSTSVGTGTSTYGYNGITIGRARDLSFYAKGTIQEVILYPSDQSANRVAMEANINSHYNIY